MDIEDSSLELISVKGKMLELVKETEKLEKVNILIHEFLRKIRETEGERLLEMERKRFEDGDFGDLTENTNNNFNKSKNGSIAIDSRQSLKSSTHFIKGDKNNSLTANTPMHTHKKEWSFKQMEKYLEKINGRI